MIRKDINPFFLSEKYLSEDPFPHAVIDNFLEEDIANHLANELEVQDTHNWHYDPHSEQINKWSMPDLNRLPTFTASTLKQFNEQPALDFFSKLTSIGPLIADPMYIGGGAHITSQGGRLGIHADFNLHPVTGFHRRLNALLFLNKNWKPEWNGQLQLWDKDLISCIKKIDPIFNRLIIFTVTDKSFHGVPDTLICPPDVRRISLALYYYTEDRPEHEKAPFHWASWQLTNK